MYVSINTGTVAGIWGTRIASIFKVRWDYPGAAGGTCTVVRPALARYPDTAYYYLVNDKVANGWVSSQLVTLSKVIKT